MVPPVHNRIEVVVESYSFGQSSTPTKSHFLIQNSMQRFTHHRLHQAPMHTLYTVNSTVPQYTVTLYRIQPAIFHTTGKQVTAIKSIFLNYFTFIDNQQNCHNSSWKGIHWALVQTDCCLDNSCVSMVYFHTCTTLRCMAHTPFSANVGAQGGEIGISVRAPVRLTRAIPQTLVHMS